jgi:hypothetical protein
MMSFEPWAGIPLIRYNVISLREGIVTTLFYVCGS